MGLFDRKKTVSNSEQNFYTENRGVQDVEDSTVLAGDVGSVYLQQSDSGAIRAGENIARDALYTGEKIAGLGIYAGTAGLEEAADLARYGVGEATDLSRRALDIGDAASARSFSLFERVIENVQESGRDFVESIGAVQQRESVNTDARLEQITRVALIGAGLIVAVALWRG